MPTYRDYLWLRQTYPTWLGNGYAAALVRTDPESLLTALGWVSPRVDVVGVGGGIGASVVEDGTWSVDLETEQTLAVASVSGDGGEWTLLAQQDSYYVGIDPVAMLPVLGERFELVCHSNIGGYGGFCWWRDGVEQIAFEPMLAMHVLHAGSHWSGDGPGATVKDLIVNRTGGIYVEPGDYTDNDHHIEGCFALAEALTGVHLSREVLDSARFTVAPWRCNPGFGGTTLGSIRPASQPEYPSVGASPVSTTPIHSRCVRGPRPEAGRTRHQDR
ncbi:DUF6461 domain-containing protein [Williamsia sterculiae]|uniref:Uncharacterized protein n=1 Tax=Williamsia sterculiae TaxID=1344003 RepID=A0A1N7HA42_9NOCA|nr:DUF6461 domain-containing protein [Williamsia sterculiae]SIS21726.1 hypothetical protein SAMN05445060_3825 [Williamsia sterculiae]